MRGRSAVLALLLAVCGSTAKADFASEAMLHDFVRGIDASADWTAAASVVRSEGGDTIAEGIVFSRDEPAASISIERLRLLDLEEGDEGGFSATEIEMTGAALSVDEAMIRIPSGTVRDVSIPSTEDLVYDPRRLMTFVSRLYTVMAEAEFTAFSVPEVTIAPQQPATATDSGEGPNGTLTYRNLTMDALRDGIIQMSQVGPVSFEGNDENGAVRFEVRSAVSERVDLGALAHVFNDASYRGGRGDAIWRPLVSKLGYSGLSASGADGATFRLDTVAIENVDGRQPDQPMTEAWDKILDPAVPEDAKSDLALEALRDMASAWRVGTIRMEGLAIDNPAQNVSAGLAGFTISGLSNQGIDSFIVKNLRGESPDGFGKLDSFELAGFVFPDSEDLMKFAALETDADPAKHAETMRGAFAALPRLSHLGLQGFSAGKSQAESVAVELFSLDFRKWNDIFAEETDIRIEGVDVPVGLMQLDPTQMQVMDTLGFDRLVLGLSLSDRWAPEAGTDDATWTMTLRDGADVELTYRLAGVTLDWMLAATAAAGKGEDSQAALMTMLNDLKLERAQLVVTDRSLLDRAFGVAAQKQGLSIDGKAYREQMRGALPFLLSAALPAELSKMLSPALQAFMAGGQKLIAEIAPSTPLPLLEGVARAGDPVALVNRLGVTVRSEAPAQ